MLLSLRVTARVRPTGRRRRHGRRLCNELTTTLTLTITVTNTTFHGLSVRGRRAKRNFSSRTRTDFFCGYTPVRRGRNPIDPSSGTRETRRCVASGPRASRLSRCLATGKKLGRTRFAWDVPAGWAVPVRTGTTEISNVPVRTGTAQPAGLSQLGLGCPTWLGCPSSAGLSHLVGLSQFG